MAGDLIYEAEYSKREKDSIVKVFHVDKGEGKDQGALLEVSLQNLLEEIDSLHRRVVKYESIILDICRENVVEMGCPLDNGYVCPQDIHDRKDCEYKNCHETISKCWYKFYMKE